jgi:hypothetical protein
MVGENENAPWSALGVSMISKIQAPTRARSRSRPRRRLMALRRCGAVAHSTNNSTTTFQLQNHHGRRERKRPVVVAWSFYDFENPSAHQGAFALEAKTATDGAETLWCCRSYYERQHCNVSAPSVAMVGENENAPLSSLGVTLQAPTTACFRWHMAEQSNIQKCRVRMMTTLGGRAYS